MLKGVPDASDDRGLVSLVAGQREACGLVAELVKWRGKVDVRSPLATYVQLRRSYVILQRINLGLYALLGELSATADRRRVAEEIWPFVQAPPSTPTRWPRPPGVQAARDHPLCAPCLPGSGCAAGNNGS